MTISKSEIIKLYKMLVQEFPDASEALGKFKKLLIGEYQPQKIRKSLSAERKK